MQFSLSRYNFCLMVGWLCLSGFLKEAKALKTSIPHKKKISFRNFGDLE